MCGPFARIQYMYIDNRAVNGKPRRAAKNSASIIIHIHHIIYACNVGRHAPLQQSSTRSILVYASAVVYNIGVGDREGGRKEKNKNRGKNPFGKSAEQQLYGNTIMLYGK